MSVLTNQEIKKNQITRKAKKEKSKCLFFYYNLIFLSRSHFQSGFFFSFFALGLEKKNKRRNGIMKKFGNEKAWTMNENQRQERRFVRYICNTSFLVPLVFLF